MQAAHSTRTLCLALLLLAAHLGTGVVLAQQPLPVSKGVYRLPYEDGTAVTITNDHLTHSSARNRLDMTGAGSPTFVVAAGAGWIRVIVENNDTSCPRDATCGSNNDCNNDGFTSNAENMQAQASVCGANYTGPSSFCCERDIENNGGTCPCPAGNPTCGATCNNPNNLVWIEHPNGEWSKYTHMQRGTIGPFLDNNGNTGQGHVLDDWVNAGDRLGIEGDVGIATGVHLHFELAVLKYVEPPTVPNDWFDGGNWLRCDECNCGGACGAGTTCGCSCGCGTQRFVNRQNRIPVFCQVDFPVIQGDTNTAGPCDDVCNAPMPDLSGTTITAGNVFYNQVPDTMGNPRGDFVAEANSGVAIRAGNRVTLSPGFHAELNSYFSASIGACDTPGGSGE